MSTASTAGSGPRPRRVSPMSVADRIAEMLADPEDTLRRHPQPWWGRQSLAGGALGIALLHVERARTGQGLWHRAETWLRYATSGPIDDGPGSHLHYGAPALAFVLHRASVAADPAGAVRPGTGRRALAALDARISHATRTRLDQAHRRIDSGRGPALAEFDAIRGLAGLGAYWLSRHPHPRSSDPTATPTDDHAPGCPADHAAELTAEVAGYLVRLSEPLRSCGPLDGGPPVEGLPGWWTPLAPSGRPSPAFPHGHVNHGVAHGIGGPLALLALTATAGIRVPGHDAAVLRIRTWLDTHRRRDATGTWWPYWTAPDPHPKHLDPAGPTDSAGSVKRIGPGGGRQGRPSWCYGSPGLARAHQLAGIARSDPGLRDVGETVLAATAHDPELRSRLDGASLCHGHAGLLHLYARSITAAPASPAVPRSLAAARPRSGAAGANVDTAAVLAVLHEAATDAAEIQLRTAQPALGLLDGLAGVALALATRDGQIEPGWDRCLLIS